MKSLQQYINESKTTLQYHETLNPKIWKGQKLLAAVRNKLLEIADFWMEYAMIDKKAVKDILLTGGNANFNYTEYSDIDLHIFVDKKKIANCEEEILDEFFKDKKTLWGLTHDITIYGIPVEIYAQDISEKSHKGQGVYSIKNNKWIRKPNYEKIDVNDLAVQKKTKSIEHQINYFIDYKIDNLDMLDKFKEKLRLMRGSAIKKGGEFSVENLAYKEVRNKGLLDKFSNYILSIQDKNLSLKK